MRVKAKALRAAEGAHVGVAETFPGCLPFFFLSFQRFELDWKESLNFCLEENKTGRGPKDLPMGPHGTLSGPSGPLTGPHGTLSSPLGSLTGPHGTLSGPYGMLSGPHGTLACPGRLTGPRRDHPRRSWERFRGES